MKLEHYLSRWSLAAICFGVVAALTNCFVPEANSQGAGALRNARTVIIECVYYSASPTSAFRTETTGIEVAGPATIGDLGLERGATCSETVLQLSLLHLELVNSTSTTGDFNDDGIVDAAHYTVWQSQIAGRRVERG